ncbi:transposase [Clostridia bacterium]|nr:transposase [Clostridia bacterium]
MRNYKHRKRFQYDGKQYSVYADTLLELGKRQAEKIAQLEKEKTEQIIQSPDMTVRQWAAVWLTTYKKPVLIESTYEDYTERLNKHILPHIGHMKLRDVRNSHLQDILSTMAGYSRDRIGKVRNCITQLFTRAVHDGNLLKSPAYDLMIPTTKPNGSRRSITAMERGYILSTANTHPAGAWVLTMLYCGLRPQETAALQGRHINQSVTEIIIEQALKSDGKIGEAKSGASKRTVPIPPQLAPYLTKVDPFDFVFKSSTGKPLTKKTMNDLWHNFKRQMNINAGCQVYRNRLMPPYKIAEDLTAYYLRHTFGCDAAIAGVDIDMLAKLMGHSNIAVTAKYYLHANEERRKQAADKMATYHSQFASGTST